MPPPPPHTHRRHSEDLIRLYGTGGIVFVNLVDKKNEQGALGEVFDAALRAVQHGAGAEDVTDEGSASGSFSEAVAGAGGGGSSGSSTTKAGAKERVLGRREAGAVPELAGTLRHVWFDFHHEVCWRVRWGFEGSK